MDNQSNPYAPKPMLLNLPAGFSLIQYFHANTDLVQKMARDNKVPYYGGESTEAYYGDIDWNALADEYPVTFGKQFVVPVIIDSSPEAKVEIVSEDFIKHSMSNPAKADEFVLAVPSGNIIGRLAQEPRPELTKEIIHSGYYVRRSWCEENIDWLQLLPYIVFYKRVEGGIMIFVYQRGKGVGEERLAGNYSIGVGGHINPHDQYEYGPDAQDHGVRGAILRNIKREVGEEVSMFRAGSEIQITDLPGYDEANFANSITNRMVAFLDYASSKVEKVHLGLFIGIEVPADVEIHTKEPELIDVGFMDLEELHRRRHEIYNEEFGGGKPLENWSKAIVESMVNTMNFQPGDVADWRNGSLARIVRRARDDNSKSYGPNLFMRV